MNKELIQKIIDAHNTLEIGKESLRKSADNLELGDSVLMLTIKDDTLKVTKIGLDEDTERTMLMAYALDSLEKQIGDDTIFNDFLEGLKNGE